MNGRSNRLGSINVYPDKLLFVHFITVAAKNVKNQPMSASPRYNPHSRHYRSHDHDRYHSRQGGYDRREHRRGYISPKDEEYIKSEVKEEDNISQSFPVKEGPNFELSGLLAEEQNSFNGVPLTFSLPVDSAKPDVSAQDWRVYEFRGDENTRVIKLHGFACFLLGKDGRLVGASIPEELTFVQVDHPMCSRQHAVIQFRRRGADGVRPYIMDLNSTNKTMLNQKPIEPGKYIELRHQDVLNFGHTDCEYVVLNATVSN